MIIMHLIMVNVHKDQERNIVKQLVNVQRILVKHVQNVHQINHITVKYRVVVNVVRDTGKSNKPNYCQLKGGGICCMNDCPISPDQPLCESVNQKDVSNTYVNALSSGSNKDKNKDKTKDNIVEVLATATFSKSDSGVEGTVKIDENGNLFVDLDISLLDTSVCNFDKNQDVELEYALYDQFDYGDLKSRNGDECTKEVIGELYNPFNVPKCSEYNGNGDKYFECAIGDLSGRFGVSEYVENNKIVI
eukprot:154965_1